MNLNTRNKLNINRKAIIVAGGLGKRLKPLTSAISKQLMPVYDKPMIYYPLSTLMLCGIRDILIVTTKDHEELFKRLLGDGNQWGIKLSYAIQNKPEGIAQAILVGKEFLGDSHLALALGDNLFHGNDLLSLLNSANSRIKGSTIFAYSVRNPQEYGVVGFDATGSVSSIEEKPDKPVSNYAITGLYFYDNTVVEKANKLNFSSRGELEITSLNKLYLDEKNLFVKLMGRGLAWFDTGNFDSLLEAGSYIRTLEGRQGLKVGCPEEISWRNKWISNDQLVKLSIPLMNSGYGNYLQELIKS